jgi:hypothetical protein
MFGLFTRGVHYVGGYGTRFGIYPFPESLFAPSYSTAKTFFTAAAAMRLQQMYPADDIFGRCVF